MREINRYKGLTNNICINCQKALGGCAWADRCEKIENWEAILVQFKFDGIHFIDSYYIIDCPEFEPDKPLTAKDLKDDAVITLIGKVYREGVKDYINAIKYYNAMKSSFYSNTWDLINAKAEINRFRKCLPDWVADTALKLYKEEVACDY